MEEIKHVSEVVFNWVARALFAVFSFNIAWNMRLQKKVNTIDKLIAINIEADKGRDSSMQRLETSVRNITDSVRSITLAVADQKEMFNITENQRREQSEIIKELKGLINHG